MAHFVRLSADRLWRAHTHAGEAADALVLPDEGSCAFFPFNRVCRTVLETDTAFDARFPVHFEFQVR
jgi:hypothetical protein